MFLPEIKFVENSISCETNRIEQLSYEKKKNSYIKKRKTFGTIILELEFL